MINSRNTSRQQFDTLFLLLFTYSRRCDQTVCLFVCVFGKGGRKRVEEAPYSTWGTPHTQRDSMPRLLVPRTMRNHPVSPLLRTPATPTNQAVSNNNCVGAIHTQHDGPEHYKRLHIHVGIHTPHAEPHPERTSTCPSSNAPPISAIGVRTTDNAATSTQTHAHTHARTHARTHTRTRKSGELNTFAGHASERTVERTHRQTNGRTNNVRCERSSSLCSSLRPCRSR